MNELDVLTAWRPGTDETDAVDHEVTARAALADAIGARDREHAPLGRRVAGRALVAAAVTTALVAGGVVVARRTLDDSADRVGRVHVGSDALDTPATGAPMNVLVVGSDSRAFVHTREQAQAFGTPAQESGQRSDTMILVRVEGDRATGIWLPRDLLVPDGAGHAVQLNSYLDGGRASLVDAVKRLTGEPVDHYVEVDFDAFIRVVDDLGGVRMYVPGPLRDSYSGLAVSSAGCKVFDGDAALAWARSRHLEQFVDGHWTDVSQRADLDRIVRQQALIRAVGAQTRARIGDDPLAVRDVVDRVFRSLVVDDRMSRDTVESLAAQLVRSDHLTMRTAPNEPSATQVGRLQLATRPAGEDFFRWATASVPGGAGSTTPPPADVVC